MSQDTFERYGCLKDTFERYGCLKDTFERHRCLKDTFERYGCLKDTFERYGCLEDLCMLFSAAKQYLYITETQNLITTKSFNYWTENGIILCSHCKE